MRNREEISKIMNEAIKNSEKFKMEGTVASYIPELATVDPDKFGIALVNTDGNVVSGGEINIKFSIQSISKVIDLIIALEDAGEEEVFSRVGTECTRYKFNSLIPIDDKVVNPLINAGAITTCSLIKGDTIDEKFERVLDKVRELSGSDDVDIIKPVYESEMKTTDTNRSIVYFLKSKGIIEGDAEEILDLYVRNCSIGLNVEQLAHIAAVFANGGMSLDRKKRLIDKEIVKITLALMATCGMYEESGRYLATVGFPSKSGVGGGIMGIIPGKYGVCTYSPRLDETGNSYRGLKVLAELSDTLGLNIFI